MFLAHICKWVHFNFKTFDMKIHPLKMPTCKKKVILKHFVKWLIWRWSHFSWRFFLLQSTLQFDVVDQLLVDIIIQLDSDFSVQRPLSNQLLLYIQYIMSYTCFIAVIEKAIRIVYDKDIVTKVHAVSNSFY